MDGLLIPSADECRPTRTRCGTPLALSCQCCLFCCCSGGLHGGQRCCRSSSCTGRRRGMRHSAACEAHLKENELVRLFYFFIFQTVFCWLFFFPTYIGLRCGQGINQSKGWVRAYSTIYGSEANLKD